MNKYFSSSKNKKYYFLILLFFVVLILVLPKITAAVNGIPSNVPPPVAATAAADGTPAGEICVPASFAGLELGYCSCFTGKCMPSWGHGDQGGFFTGNCKSDEDCGGVTGGPDNAGNADFDWNPFKAIGVGFARLILYICWSLASWASELFFAVLAWMNGKPITTDILFAPAWGSVRDLANMVIVLGFVIVGVATALRIKTYAAGQLLWKLIVVALFVNFSGLFCGLIIDASTILTKTFTGGSGEAGRSIVQVMANAGRDRWDSPFVEGSPWTFVGEAMLACAAYVAIAITFVYISIILIIRYATLAMLFILSPLAFAFWVFPASKKLWTDWWTHFLKWAFVGVIACFFLGIATSLIPKDGKMDPYTLVIMLGFIMVGFKISAKSSGLAAMASGAVMGLTGAAVGVGMGAIGAGGLSKLLPGKAGKGAQMGAKIGENTKLGEWAGNKRDSLKSGALGALSRVGLARGGMASGSNIKTVDKRQSETTSKMTDDEVLSDMDKSGAIGAAGFKEATKRKILYKYKQNSDGSVNINALAARAARAGGWGVDTGDAEKLIPELAGRNEGKIKSIMEEKTPRGIGMNPATGAKYTKPEAEREAIRRRTAGMSIPDMRNVRQITPDHIEDSNFKTYARASLEYTTDQRDGAQKALPELRDRRNIAMGIGGATAADRDASFQAYRALSPAAQTAYTATLTPEAYKKVEDFNKKISITKRL